MASKHFLYFFKFFKYWAAATVLVVVPNALYIHCQICSQHISLICTHMPTWTWVISIRRKHRLSKPPSKLETPAQNLKPQFKTWNPSAEMSYLVMIYLRIFNASRQPKVRTSPSHENTIRKIKHQLSYNDFRDSRAREEKSGFSLFDPCYALIWNKRVLD